MAGTAGEPMKKPTFFLSFIEECIMDPSWSASVGTLVGMLVRF